MIAGVCRTWSRKNVWPHLQGLQNTAHDLKHRANFAAMNHPGPDPAPALPSMPVERHQRADRHAEIA